MGLELSSDDTNRMESLFINENVIKLSSTKSYFPKKKTTTAKFDRSMHLRLLFLFLMLFSE
jgi:hypothetical protein